MDTVHVHSTDIFAPLSPPAQGTHKRCPICINLTFDSRIAKGLQPFDGVWGVPKNLFSSPPQAARGVKGRAWGLPKPRKAGRSPLDPRLRLMRIGHPQGMPWAGGIFKLVLAPRRGALFKPY